MSGPINRGSFLGEYLFSLATCPEIKTVVEIGTWNGQGSTICLKEGIAGKSDAVLYSVESNKHLFDVASKFHKDATNVKLIYGRVVDPVNIAVPENVSEMQMHWFQSDLADYYNCPCILSALPEKIDLLLLDGGEFSSDFEFQMLYPRATHIVLDDVNPRGSIKFVKTTPFINQHQSQFEMLAYLKNDRNGWLHIANVKGGACE